MKAATGMRVTGVVQAGGRSTRMGGRPKALIEIGGRRIIERVVHAIAPLVDALIVVTNTPDAYAFLGLPMVADLYPDGGSLGGIYSGLQAASADAAFTVACDMPFLHREVARLVIERAGEADVVIPRAAGELQTLHAAYSRACLEPMRRRLDAGRLKIIGFFDEVRVLEIDEAAIARHRAPEIVFMNVNTPEELARAQAIELTLADTR